MATSERSALMHLQIDWLSFTLPIKPIDSSRLDLQQTNIRQALRQFGQFYDAAIVPSISRKPYSLGFALFPGCWLFAGNYDHAAIDISGQGCAALGGDLMIDILKRAGDRVTRIDLAADMACNTKPTTFVEYSDAKRIRSRSEVVSPKGHTVYIGSPKSDRYARVYRYAEPHPRAAYLRCEMVFRRKQAKQVASYIAENGLLAGFTAFSGKFGWQHPSWVLENAETPAQPRIERNRSDDKTMRWLIEAAAPAFKRLVESGAIQEPMIFLEENFL